MCAKGEKTKGVGTNRAMDFQKGGWRGATSGRDDHYESLRSRKLDHEELMEGSRVPRLDNWRFTMALGTWLIDLGAHILFFLFRDTHHSSSSPY